MMDALASARRLAPEREGAMIDNEAGELAYLEARLDEAKIKVERLAQRLRAAAEVRKRLRRELGPGKLEKLDAVAQEIRLAIVDLRCQKVQGADHRRQARPTEPRCSFHLRPDDPQDALHRG
jgi:hypothetical protein